MKVPGKGSFSMKMTAMAVLIASAFVGCAASGSGLTDTGTGCQTP